MAETLSGAAGVARVDVMQRGRRAVVPPGVTILVLGEDDPFGRWLPGVLLEHPDLSVFVLRDGGVVASLVELWPRTSELADVSPASLRSVVRSATVWAARFHDG